MQAAGSSASYVIGLMSGTSTDGVDAALVEVQETGDALQTKLAHFTELPFSQGLRTEILSLCDHQHAKIEELSLMNMLLGEIFSDAAKKVMEESGVPRSDILLISSHGQTVFHQPEPRERLGRNIISTLQIGDISVIAERTGILTVGDFRTRDMAAGGQGAPLVPYVDHLLFRSPDHGRVLLNIGGISNMTILPKNAAEEEVIAYDTGPGNMIMDEFAGMITGNKQRYDMNGEIAGLGTVDEEWLDEMLSHPFFRKKAPKSTGREEFGKVYALQLWKQAAERKLSMEDRLATVTALTARAIAMEISPLAGTAGVKEVLVSGGGSRNKTLLEYLATSLPSGMEVNITDALGIPADAKEAVAFAVLGYQCYKGRYNTLPSATGASKPVVMGKMAW